MKKKSRYEAYLSLNNKYITQVSLLNPHDYIRKFMLFKSSTLKN